MIVVEFLEHEDDFEDISLHQQLFSDDEATSSFEQLCTI